MRLILVFLLVTSSLVAQIPQSSQLSQVELKVSIEPKNDTERYRFTKGKIWGLAAVGLGSFVWYAKERYEFQGRHFFEVKFNAKPYGFWGSKSFLKPYNEPNFYNQTFGAFDYYHVSNILGKYAIIGGSITIGISGAKRNKRKLHFLYDALLTVGTSILFSRLGDHVMKL